jgi:DNA-binding transcriptional regulator YhcF (GntR family)
MPAIEQSVTTRIRDRIVSGLHRGRLRGGDRLPSFREMAQETGADHRVVADAYRTLEAEGLVEIRGRSGVYVAEQERLGGLMLSETSRWLASVMAEAWKRGIMSPALPEMIRRCNEPGRLRCAFVESNEDHMTAFSAELEPAFGLDCKPVYLDIASDTEPEHDMDRERLRAALDDVDLVVTTAFHGALVHGLTEGMGKPLVVVSANPELGYAVERRLREADLTVVCADARFGERIRYVYGGDLQDRVRVVLASDAWAVAHLDPSEPVLLTRAARRRLLDDVELPMIVPHSPTLSFESARELSEMIIRLNLNSASPLEPVESAAASCTQAAAAM